jgi:hypothetical protein
VAQSRKCRRGMADEGRAGSGWGRSGEGFMEESGADPEFPA